MPATVHNLFDLILSNHTNRIKKAFKFMEIAEDEIAMAKERWPLSNFDKCFLILRPYEKLFNDKSDMLYRVHCRELLDRVVQNKDCLNPTKAEICAVLCDLSLLSPLTHDTNVLYTNLFRDLFPDKSVNPYNNEASNPDLKEKMCSKLRREISLVLPARGERDRIKEHLEKLKAELEALC